MDIWDWCFEMNVYYSIKSCSGLGRSWGFGSPGFCWVCPQLVLLHLFPCVKKTQHVLSACKVIWDWVAQKDKCVIICQWRKCFKMCICEKRRKNFTLKVSSSERMKRQLRCRNPKILDSTELQTTEQNVCPTFTLDHNWWILRLRGNYNLQLLLLQVKEFLVWSILMKGSFVTASDIGIRISCPEGKLNCIVIIAFHGSAPFTACVCHINDRRLQQLSKKTPMTSSKPRLHPFLLRFLACLQELH